MVVRAADGVEVIDSFEDGIVVPDFAARDGTDRLGSLLKPGAGI